MSRLVYNPIFAVITSILVTFLCVSLFLNSREIRQSQSHISFLEKNVEQEEQKTKLLEEKLAQAKSPEQKEAAIRNQLLMQKPGEYIVQIPDMTVPSPTPSVAPQPLSPWQQWKKLLF
jgi:hypothetical protein